MKIITKVLSVSLALFALAAPLMRAQDPPSPLPHPEQKVEDEPEPEMLDEVVFIGYGAVRKSDLVTSVTSVKAEDM